MTKRWICSALLPNKYRDSDESFCLEQVRHGLELIRCGPIDDLHQSPLIGGKLRDHLLRFTLQSLVPLLLEHFFQIQQLTIEFLDLDRPLIQLRLQMTESDKPGERLHSANAGGDGAFTDDLEQPKLPGPQHVGAAAQLHGIPIQAPGIPTDLHHANFRPIFLAEKLHDIGSGFHLFDRELRSNLPYHSPRCGY